MQGAAQITVMSFGEGRRELLVEPAEATIGEIIRKIGIDPNCRRIAVNGKKVVGTTTVEEGDLVTFVPKVVGG